MKTGTEATVTATRLKVVFVTEKKGKKVAILRISKTGLLLTLTGDMEEGQPNRFFNFEEALKQEFGDKVIEYWRQGYEDLKLSDERKDNGDVYGMIIVPSLFLGCLKEEIDSHKVLLVHSGMLSIIEHRLKPDDFLYLKEKIFAP